MAAIKKHCNNNCKQTNTHRHTHTIKQKRQLNKQKLKTQDWKLKQTLKLYFSLQSSFFFFSSSASFSSLLAWLLLLLLPLLLFTCAYIIVDTHTHTKLRKILCFNFCIYFSVFNFEIKKNRIYFFILFCFFLDFGGLFVNDFLAHEFVYCANALLLNCG